MQHERSPPSGIEHLTERVSGLRRTTKEQGERIRDLEKTVIQAKTWLQYTIILALLGLNLGKEAVTELLKAALSSKGLH